LDCEAVDVNVVQVENVVIDSKHAFGAVADHLRSSVVAPGERESHSTHEHVGFGVSCDTAGQN
jgi:hypothetical protein